MPISSISPKILIGGHSGRGAEARFAWEEGGMERERDRGWV